MIKSQNMKKEPYLYGSIILKSGVARGIRTPDRRLRRPLLYPAELLQHLVDNDYYILITVECKALIGIKLTIIKF